MWNRDWILAAVRELKRIAPETRITAGGPEVTADPEGFRTSAPFDFVISGEGEIPFLETVNRLEEGATLSGIPGVFTPQGGWPAEPGITDLDEIPSPWLNGSLNPGHGALWELSRGCPFRCDFCYESRGMSGVRRHSLERIRDELIRFRDAGTEQLYLLDPTFNADRKRAKAILRMIAETAPEIHYTFEVRTEFLDREMATLFGSLHCAVQIGLQSCHAEVLKNVNRDINREQFQQRVMLLNHAGVIFGLDLIYGMPEDTLSRYRESLDFALELMPNQLDLFPLSVLPGTKLADTAAGFGLVWDPDPPYTTRSSPGFDPQDRARAAALTRSTQLFYSRGRAVAWFMPLVWTLDTTPSALLERFSREVTTRGWMEQDPPEEKLEEAQREFVKHCLKEKQKGSLTPLLYDLIAFHHAWGRALADGVSDAKGCPPGQTPDPDKVWKLRKDIKLFVTEHDLFALQECGMVPLEEMSETCPRSRSWCMAFFGPGGVEMVSLYENCFHLLKEMDGTIPLKALLDRFGSKRERTLTFLTTMAEEGLMQPV